MLWFRFIFALTFFELSDVGASLGCGVYCIVFSILSLLPIVHPLARFEYERC